MHNASREATEARTEAPHTHKPYTNHINHTDTYKTFAVGRRCRRCLAFLFNGTHRQATEPQSEAKIEEREETLQKE